MQKKSIRVISLLFCLLLMLSACQQSAPVSTEVKTITVEITHGDGSKVSKSIETSAQFLRGALEEQNLVQGDESATGLYVKVVDGERADYNEDGAWWGFYKGGEMLTTGVDTTPIADGDTFEIIYTKN